MASPTVIFGSNAIQSTNFGSAPGADSVTNIFGGANASRVIGSLFTVALNAESVASSQTDLVKGEFKAPFKLRIKSVVHGNQAVTATASFNLYNVTDSASVVGSTALTSAAEGVVSSFAASGRNVIDDGDVVQLRCTTDGTGAITSLKVYLVCEAIGDPDNIL